MGGYLTLTLTPTATLTLTLTLTRVAAFARTAGWRRNPCVHHARCILLLQIHLVVTMGVSVQAWRHQRLAL